VTNERIGYRKEYNIRRAQKGQKKTLEVTFPYEVVEKEARAREMSVDEFIGKFKVAAQYDAFEGVHYAFIVRKDGRQQPE